MAAPPAKEVLYTCARCGHPRSQKGGGMRFILGLRRRVCKQCAEFIDRTKLPRRNYGTAKHG